MPGQGWQLANIPWDNFDPERVDPEILGLVKAASLVESNGRDYGAYLCNVFHADRDFQAEALNWAEEEVGHGRALVRWANLADPRFDFAQAFAKFTAGYPIPVESSASLRGSLSGELVARCVVEVGTSSYYSALADACREPLLKAICRKIAADEFRHYRLFYDHLQNYLRKESIGPWRRVLVALRRALESEDDELAYAYYAANGGDRPYDRRTWSRGYLWRTYRYYRPHHVDRAVAMIFKAAGLRPRGRLSQLTAAIVGARFRACGRKALPAPG